MDKYLLNIVQIASNFWTCLKFLQLHDFFSWKKILCWFFHFHRTREGCTFPGRKEKINKMQNPLRHVIITASSEMIRVLLCPTNERPAGFLPSLFSFSRISHTRLLLCSMYEIVWAIWNDDACTVAENLLCSILYYSVKILLLWAHFSFGSGFGRLEKFEILLYSTFFC